LKNYLIFYIPAFLFVSQLQTLYAQSLPVNRPIRRVTGVRVDTLSLQGASEKKQKSYFETGISYQNNDVYFGRKDSSALPYFIPVLSYYNKSGIYFSAFINYLSSADASRVDAITVEGGYIFHTGNYDGQVNISKFIYNRQSTSVSSEIQASAGYQNGYDFGIIKTFLNLGLDFGPQIDYSASLGLEHGFSILHDKAEFTPGICVNAGTQNFYNNYYENKRYSNSGKGKSTGNTGETIMGSVVNPSNFKILDYEASIPFTYNIQKLAIHFTPTYAMPVNPSLIDVNTKQSGGNSSNKTVTEHLTNSFYMSVGLSFKFG
jgi:hypothetical protein